MALSPTSRPDLARFDPPHFDVQLSAPDLAPWLAGNVGLPGFTTIAGPRSGPHVGLIALMHGNEFAGAIVLDRLLRTALRPICGQLTVGFVNLEAFARFDPAHPTTSRFVDEDMNRLWDESALGANRRSAELDRARQIRPMIDRFDVLLDLHSMLWPSEPLLLCGSSAKGMALGCAVATPPMIVADGGHATGRRLIDYARFNDPATQAAAILLESGQHWQPESIAVTEACVAALLQHTGLAAPSPAQTATTTGTPKGSIRVAVVTQAITAASANFSFVQAFRGGQTIARADTLIAMDGTQEIRTPHDDCLLVMPSLRPSRGHTAVRLARETRLPPDAPAKS